VDFAHIHQCVFLYPQRVTKMHARDKHTRARSTCAGATTTNEARACESNNARDHFDATKRKATTL